MTTTYTPAPFFQISLVSILLVWPLWKFFRKAGFSGALALLFLVPVVDVLLIFIWPWPSGLLCATMSTMMIKKIKRYSDLIFLFGIILTIISGRN